MIGWTAKDSSQEDLRRISSDSLPVPRASQGQERHDPGGQAAAGRSGNLT